MLIGSVYGEESGEAAAIVVITVIPDFWSYGSDSDAVGLSPGLRGYGVGVRWGVSCGDFGPQLWVWVNCLGFDLLAECLDFVLQLGILFLESLLL